MWSVDAVQRSRLVSQKNSYIVRGGLRYMSFAMKVTQCSQFKLVDW